MEKSGKVGLPPLPIKGPHPTGRCPDPKVSLCSPFFIPEEAHRQEHLHKLATICKKIWKDYYIGDIQNQRALGSKNTIRNARITKLIPLEYFDVMHMKSSRKIIPQEFSDVIIM